MTQRMAFLPMAVAVTLIAAHGIRTGPGLWMALGASAALALMLWSAYAIHRPWPGRTRLACRMAAASDSWFPTFVIFVQGGIAAVTLLMFCFTLVELGYRSAPMQFPLLAALLILLPFRRLSRLRNAEQSTAGRELTALFAQYLHWILLTLFLATTIGNLGPSGPAASTDESVGGLLIWIPAILVIVSCVVLFIDHVIRKMPRRRIDARESDSLD